MSSSLSNSNGPYITPLQTIGFLLRSSWQETSVHPKKDQGWTFFFYGYISHLVLALHFLLLLRGDGRGTKQRAGRQARGASTLFFILFLSFYSPRHNHQKLQYTGRVALHSSSYYYCYYHYYYRYFAIKREERAGEIWRGVRERDRGREEREYVCVCS